MNATKSECAGKILNSFTSPLSPVSRSSSVNRQSVTVAAAQLKASKVRLFRNGDPFFKGIVLAITPGRFRTFDSLLAELNKTTLCDPSVLHKGVRYIFTLSGEQVRSLDQLQDGNAYVCASTPVLRSMNYSKITKPTHWSMNFRTGDESKTGIAKSFGDFKDLDRNYIEPKMIYTIRAGPRPRNMARSLLNKRTARSFDQVMTDLAESVNMETGTIRQLYKITGSQDFFQEECVFVAFGSEKFSLSELKLNEVETKFVSGSTQRNSRISASKTLPLTKRKDSKSPDRRSPRTVPDSASDSEQAMSDNRGASEHWTSPSATAPSSVRGNSPELLADSPEQANDHAQPDRPVVAATSIEHQEQSPRVIAKGEIGPSEAAAPPFVSASPRNVAEELKAAGSRPLPPARLSHPTTTTSSSVYADNDDAFEQVSYIRDDLNIPISLQNKYLIGQVGAKHTYVTLRTATDRKTQVPVAIKIYHKAKMGTAKDCFIFSELSLMKRMKHENLIHLLDDMSTSSEIYLILEMPKGTDLFEAITSSSNYSEVDAGQLFFQLCFAISFLHSINVVHRNIRPESILVVMEQTGRRHLKLCDFTMASEIFGPLNSPCGILAYMAPEMLSEKHYGTKVDVWSAGVVGYIMLCGFLPYVGSTAEELISKIKSGPIDFPSPAWNFISDTAKDLIAFMLEEDVNIRSTAADVLDHPWLTGSELNKNNLQPLIGSHIRKFANQDTCRRTFAALIGLRHVDRKSSQLQLEVYKESAADELPLYPPVANAASSPRMASGSPAPYAYTVGSTPVASRN